MRIVFITRVFSPFQRFFATTAASGIVLLACTAFALSWANSPWANAYHHFWELPFTVGVPDFALTLNLHAWVNDGLMAVFFLLVGLEIKREVLVGELATRRTATLPVAAAFGGMIVPASLYALFNANGPGAAGWGVPMATDIAFALGVLALLGDRVPTGLRVFLAALAIADDLGAVLVIALFYTNALNWAALGGAALVLLALLIMNRSGVQRLLLYVMAGVLLWGCMLASGVHATIAGVLLALMVPSLAQTREGATSTMRAPLQRMEHALHGYVAFLIMPLFAIANAGVSLGRADAALHSPVVWGIVAGLVLGKPIGITLASVIAVRSGAASLPTGVTWRHLHGAAWLGGIGFTMSLFVAGLAFIDTTMLDAAKLGIFGASVCAGVIGFALLRNTRRYVVKPGAP